MDAKLRRLNPAGVLRYLHGKNNRRIGNLEILDYISNIFCNINNCYFKEKLTVKRLALVLSVLACGLLFGQDKVAYISMEKAWGEFYKTCNANVIFEQKKVEFEEKMSILQQSLEAEAKELKSLQADATNELLSADASEEAKRKFRVRAELFAGKRDDFERTRRAGVQDLQEAC